MMGWAGLLAGRIISSNGIPAFHPMYERVDTHNHAVKERMPYHRNAKLAVGSQNQSATLGFIAAMDNSEKTSIHQENTRQ